ncbi:MAG: DUF2062 domain-containing protein, partial [Desulfobacteraceae bacterium]|nr:DUF2062 domain-containing protein [Desulfobacteraceae bacterium]
NWYFLYYYSYILGAHILGLPEKNDVFSSIMIAIRSGDGSMVVLRETFGAGGMFASAFLLGGLVMGLVAALPSYLLFLFLFKRIRMWRRARRKQRNRRPEEQ